MWSDSDFNELVVFTDGSKSVKSIFNRLSPLIVASMYDDDLFFIQIVKPYIEYMFQQLVLLNVPINYFNLNSRSYIQSENYLNTFTYLNNLLCAYIWERKQLLDPISFGLQLLFYNQQKIYICQCGQPTCNQVHVNLSSFIIKYDDIVTTLISNTNSTLISNTNSTLTSISNTNSSTILNRNSSTIPNQLTHSTQFKQNISYPIQDKYKHQQIQQSNRQTQQSNKKTQQFQQSNKITQQFQQSNKKTNQKNNKLKKI